MKKLIIVLAMLVAAVSVVQALPTTDFAAGEFGEEYGLGGPGSASTASTNGYIDATDSWWFVTKAYHQGAANQGGGIYKTEYTDAWGVGSVVSATLNSVTYSFTDFSMWVIADTNNKTFTFTLSGTTADGLYAISCLNGSGKINEIAAIPPGITNPAWVGYDQWGGLKGDITVSAIPVPGAILLGGIGTGLVGWLRRRRAL